MPKHTTRRTRLPLPTTGSPSQQASALDRLADMELQHGHVAHAEHLAQLAAEIRAAQ